MKNPLPPLLEAFPDALAYGRILQDENGGACDCVFLAANKAFEAATGLSKNEILGKTLTQVFGSPLPSCWLGRLQRGKVVRVKHRSDVTGLWYEITAYTVEPGHCAAVFRDITEQVLLEGRLQYQLRFEQMMSSISSSFESLDGGDLDETIKRALGEMATFFNADRGAVFQLTPEQGTLNLTHEWCSERAVRLSGNLLSIDPEALPWLFAQAVGMKPIHVGDTDTLPGAAQAEKHQFDKHNIRAFFILPFPINKGDGQGFLALDSTEKQRALSKQQVQLLSIGTRTIAGSLAKRLIEEERNKALERYRSIVENVGDGFFIYDFEGTIADLNETACNMVGYDRDDLLGANITVVLPPKEQGYIPSYTEKLLEKERILFESRLLHKNGSIVPVEISQTIVTRKGKGIIQGFVRDITRRKLSEMQIERYSQELEELYSVLDAEMDKARTIHERTLPQRLPRIKGISLASHYQPARKIGGDFYDVIRLDQKLVIYLSDVTGHGVDGAMLSMFVKHTVTSYLAFTPENKVSPKSIVRYLSRRVQDENLPEEYFISIFVGVLDLKTMRLRYTAAGFQDTPLVSLGDGTRTKLVSKGLFLSTGFAPRLLSLREHSLLLSPGTSILFNTDGLTEQNARGVYYGTRLPTVFYENSHFPPSVQKHIVCEDFRAFNKGSVQGDDDVTFLVLQVNPGRITRRAFAFPSRLSELGHLRNRVSVLLGERPDAPAFLACLHEIAANAVEHGNKLNPGKKVCVEIAFCDRYIQGKVRDEGDGFDWRSYIDKPLDLAGLSERGRGIAMARLHSSRLIYNNKGNGAIFVTLADKH